MGTFFERPPKPAIAGDAGDPIPRPRSALLPGGWRFPLLDMLVPGFGVATPSSSSVISGILPLDLDLNIPTAFIAAIPPRPLPSTPPPSSPTPPRSNAAALRVLKPNESLLALAKSLRRSGSFSNIFSLSPTAATTELSAPAVTSR